MSNICEPNVPDTANINTGTYESSLEKGEIRLLTILPGSSSEEIQGTFQTEQLLDQPDYTAISYCWGKMDFQRTIRIDTKQLHLSENLYNILLDLRQPAESITVWVDFFSINQGCDKEKSLQVGQMHSIYKGAKQVIAFLGHHQDGSDLLFQILRKFESEGPHALSLFSDGTEEKIKMAWEKLLMREYWSRAWIMQEIIFGQANDLQLRCGPDQISYKTMKDFELSLRTNISCTTNNTKPISNCSYNIPTRCELLEIIQGSTMSFRFFLHAFLDCLCSNPRDSIFAFTHLLEHDLDIEYNKPPELTIPQAFRTIIERTQNLYLLLLRGRQKTPTATSDSWQHLMPSWCPFVGTPYKFHHDIDESQALQNVKHALITFDNHNRLHCQGIIVGRISRIQKSRARARRANIRRPTLLELVKFATRTNRKVKLSERIRSWMMLVDTRLSTPSMHLTVSKPGFLARDPAVDCYWDKIRLLMSDLRTCAFEWNDSLPESIIPRVYRPKDVAFVPTTAREGDYLCAVSECEEFVVLRQRDTHYKAVGEALISCADGRPSLPCATVLDGHIKLHEIVIG